LIHWFGVPPRPLHTDLTAITALGLLSERPRHPYEMQRLIRFRDKSYVKGLPRSLYHAIDRLAAAGLVEVGEISREGRRPERTVYAITDNGREELDAWLGDLLATHEPSDPAPFSAGLSLIAYLSPERALGALRARLTALDLELAGGEARMKGLRKILPRLLMLEEEQRLAAVAAERAFTARLVEELDRGDLTWNVEQLRRLAETTKDDDLTNLREAFGERG
jgi:DNA-binding PadR family transcriptional regulator